MGRSWQICQCQVDKNKTRSGPWILLNSDSSWRFAEFLHLRILRFPCLPRMIVKMVRRSSYGSYSCFGCFFCAIPSFSLESGKIFSQDEPIAQVQTNRTERCFRPIILNYRPSKITTPSGEEPRSDLWSFAARALWHAMEMKPKSHLGARRFQSTDSWIGTENRCIIHLAAALDFSPIFFADDLNSLKRPPLKIHWSAEPASEFTN